MGRDPPGGRSTKTTQGVTAILWTSRRELTKLSETVASLGVFAELQGRLDDAVELRDTAKSLNRMSDASRTALVRAARQGKLLPAGQGVPKGVFKFRLKGPDGYDRYLKLSGSTAFRIQEICQHGSDFALQAEWRRLGLDLAALLAGPLTTEEVLALHRGFGAVTAADFSATLAALPDTPSAPVARRLAPKLREALTHLRKGRARIPLGRAHALLEAVTEYVQDVSPDVFVEAAGSLRRAESTVGDVLLIAVSPSPATIIDVLCDSPEIDVRFRSPDATTVLIRKEEVHVRTSRAESLAPALLHYTGSPAHVHALRERAAARGWHLSAQGLFEGRTGRVIEVESEAAIYARLDLPYIPPELRHGEDEIAVAERGGFPSLIDLTDIRGDLHTHTLWSDGRDTVGTMVRAAERLGYEYLAITDHSPSAQAARVLTIERLKRQMDEIRALRASHPNILILQGVEVDILPDGSLDLPDELLAELDVVLASLHDRAGHDELRLLDRYKAAMDSPYVHIITHPTNRTVGRHAGYALDFRELFRHAVRTQTILEVDGAPSHLDMDGHLAGAAVSSGVLVSIDSDCHNASYLARQMRFGVATARRGQVRREQVINTKPAHELRALLSRKRAAVGQASAC